MVARYPPISVVNAGSHRGPRNLTGVEPIETYEDEAFPVVQRVCETMAMKHYDEYLRGHLSNFNSVLDLF